VFLIQCSAGLLLACLPPRLRLNRRSRQVVCVDEVLGPLAGVPEDLAALGQAYLDENKGENEGEVLVDTVFGPVSEGQSLTDALRDVIAAEHASGAVVSAAGWRLARTEARLAALVFLAGQC
jgi:hypothetical protein